MSLYQNVGAVAGLAVSGVVAWPIVAAGFVVVVSGIFGGIF